MRRFLLALSFLLCTAFHAHAQNAITLPIAANAVADLGNGPIKVRMIAGNASIFTSQGSGIGSTSGSSTTLTLTATPAIPPIVGGLISGAGITSGTTVAAYNGTTGITLSAAMTVAGGTTVSWSAACPSTPPSNVIQASPQADYYMMYTQARVCAVSPGGPVNTLLIEPIFYDQTTSGGGGGTPVIQAGQALGNPTGTSAIPTGTFLDQLFFGTDGNQFQILPRPTITTHSVAALQPTQANTIATWDLFPKGSPSPSGEGFITWHDDCDADLIANASAPVGCARFGADTTLGYSAFGSVAYNGGTLRPLCLFYGIITNVVNCVATYATGWTFNGGTAAVNLNAAPIPSALLGGDVAFAAANVDGQGTRYIAIATPNGGTDSPSFTGMYANGTLAAPTAIVNGNNLVSFGGGGAYCATCVSGGPGWVFGRGSFQVYADANWSSTSEPTRDCEYTTAINAVVQAPWFCVFNDGGTYFGTFSGTTPPVGADKGPSTVNLAAGGGYYLNGNPASTTLAVIAAGVNFNAVGDTPLSVSLPAWASRYLINSIRIIGATGSLTASQVGVFTATSGGGTQIVTSGSAVTVSTASDGTANNAQNLTINNNNLATYTVAGFPTLYFRVTQTEGNSAFADVELILTPTP